MTGLGRLNSVTNGRFQESEFNDSFPAINLKRRQSPGDPFLPVGLLQSGQWAETKFWNWRSIKPTLATSTKRPQPVVDDAGVIFRRLFQRMTAFRQATLRHFRLAPTIFLTFKYFKVQQ